jgi:hypothetical protein
MPMAHDDNADTEATSLPERHASPLWTLALRHAQSPRPQALRQAIDYRHTVAADLMRCDQ